MLYTFVQIALMTGMRMNEIASLLWEQIDFERNVIIVGKSKSNKSTGRQIAIDADLRAVLDLHASWNAEKFGEIKPEWFVFPGGKGRPQNGVERPLLPTIHIQSVKDSWERLRERAGVKCRFHNLRHYADFRTMPSKLAGRLIFASFKRQDSA